MIEHSGIQLNSTSKVLDIGSGLGGTLFYLVEKTGCRAVGVDLVPYMIDESKKRCVGNALFESRIEFILGDAAVVDVGAEKFDLIFSRDTILHIADKATLFARCRSLLKPDGLLLISDYCRKVESQPLGDEFAAYVQASGYHLVSVDAYGNLLRSCGFGGDRFRCEDHSADFRSLLERELKMFESQKDIYIANGDITPADFAYLVERWIKKMRMVDAGDMVWGWFSVHPN